MEKYLIKSEHDVHFDSYEEGQLENVNFYTESSMVYANNPEDAIEKYFEEKIYFSFKWKYAQVDGDLLFYDVLVDDDNNEVKKGDVEYEEWKKGNERLYANSISLTIQEVSKPLVIEKG